MSYHPMLAVRREAAARPAAFKAETFSRVGGHLANTTLLSSGRLQLVGIFLPAGLVVSTISFFSGSTALSGASNQWFSLWSPARAKLGVTNDDGATAWSANAEKPLSLVSPFTVLADGMYYLGLTVVASTVPTLLAQASQAPVSGKATAVAGSADTGLTDPASAPATCAAPTGAAHHIYAAVA